MGTIRKHANVADFNSSHPWAQPCACWAHTSHCLRCLGQSKSKTLAKLELHINRHRRKGRSDTQLRCSKGGRKSTTKKKKRLQSWLSGNEQEQEVKIMILNKWENRLEPRPVENEGIHPAETWKEASNKWGEAQCLVFSGRLRIVSQVNKRLHSWLCGAGMCTDLFCEINAEPWQHLGQGVNELAVPWDDQSDIWTEHEWSRRTVRGQVKAEIL